MKQWKDYLGLALILMLGSGYIATSQAQRNLESTKFIEAMEGCIDSTGANTCTGGGGVFTTDDGDDIATLREGTTSKSARIYNTFTDASNYERLTINPDTNVLGTATVGWEIFPETAGTGTDNIALHVAGAGTGHLILGQPGVIQSNVLVILPSTSNRFAEITRLANEAGNTNIDIATNGAAITWDWAGATTVEVLDNSSTAYALTFAAQTNPGTAATEYFFMLDSTNSAEEFNFGTPFTPEVVTQSALPSSGAGSIVYCSDCNPDATCTGSGSGAFAFNVAGSWACELN